MPWLTEKELQRYAAYSLSKIKKLMEQGKISSRDFRDILDYTKKNRLPRKYRAKIWIRKRFLSIKYRLPKRPIIMAYLGEKWIDLLALIVAVLALIRTFE